MIIAYLNYGYYYVYYGYTQAQVFEMIIENLIGTEIMLQYIMDEYESAGKIENSDKDKYTAIRYLDAEEVRDAEYDTLYSINVLIDGFMETDPTYADTYGESVRTVPTNATNAEKDVEFFKAPWSHQVVLNPENFALIFPNDLHVGGYDVEGTDSIKKLVFKLKID